jgi:ABC-type transport system involved in multi-copper enzyme maturation permease subunit
MDFPPIDSSRLKLYSFLSYVFGMIWLLSLIASLIKSTETISIILVSSFVLLICSGVLSWIEYQVVRDEKKGIIMQEEALRNLNKVTFTVNTNDTER